MSSARSRPWARPASRSRRALTSSAQQCVSWCPDGRRDFDLGAQSYDCVSSSLRAIKAPHDQGAPMTVPLEINAVKSESTRDAALIEDIRLLGQVLGDTIREQEGDSIFQRIENIRRLSVAFERSADKE